MLTDEQRLFFETNGYLVIPIALSQDALANLRAAADRAEAEWRADPSRPGQRTPNLQQVQAIMEYDPIFLDLLTHPILFPMVRAILGDTIQMIDHDYFISPPHTNSHAHWHHDTGMGGVHHPLSTLMVKAFYLLSDVPEGGGGTALIPGSHRYPMDFPLPRVENPDEMPGKIVMAHPAGTAYFFHGYIYHAALNNRTDQPRRVLIYNYGHNWMRIWPGYEPSDALNARATTPLLKQLLGMSDAYVMRLEPEA